MDTIEHEREYMCSTCVHQRYINKKGIDIMALEDYLEPEIAVTAVVVAAVASPRARKIIRRGAVYGLAGILVAGDALTTVGKGIGRGVQAAGVAASHVASNTVQTAQAATSNRGQAATTTATSTDAPQTTTFPMSTGNASDAQKRASSRSTIKNPQEGTEGQV
jgi:hypothetical protein